MCSRNVQKVGITMTTKRDKSTKRIHLVLVATFGVVVAGLLLAATTNAVTSQNTDSPPMGSIASLLTTSVPATSTLYLQWIQRPFEYFLPVIQQPPFLDKPFPPNASTGKSLNTYLAWKVFESVFRNPMSFTIYLEANNPTPQTVVADMLNTPAFDPETLSEDTQYYWKVVAVDASGQRVESDTWTFRTEAKPNPPDLAAMVEVPAGPFIMGCDLSNPHEDYCSYNVWHQDEPVRIVTIDAFEIDKYEVTNSEYRDCMEAGVCGAPALRHYVDNLAYDLYPISFISWWDANTFCAWEGKRLPTEAEWEKAARGPIDTRKWPWGNEEPDCHRVNSILYRSEHDCDLLPKGQVPVGRYPRGATPYGAYDMAGNVFEWVNDKYDVNYYNYAPNDNPQGPPYSRTYRTLGDAFAPLTYEERGYPIFTIRDGPWTGHAHYMRVSHRHFGHHGILYEIYGDAPFFRNERVGFRCARPIEAE